MNLRRLLYIWLGTTLVLAFEYAHLHGMLGRFPSFLQLLLCKSPHYCQYANPSAGKPLSLFMGCVGFILICMTAFYSLRKRAHFLQKSGPIPNWLHWHIFFGLMGPTLIVFHTNFKVGGLVAVSFWAMMITVLSGVVGRFLYMQLLFENADLKKKFTFFRVNLRSM